MRELDNMNIHEYCILNMTKQNIYNTTEKKIGTE